MMQPSRIFETVFYAEDLASAERFYHQALGLEVISIPEELPISFGNRTERLKFSPS